MALLVTHDIGSNSEGLDGFTLVSAPVDNGDYYTFDGTDDGLQAANYGDETNIDIYVKFRVHDKGKGSAQHIWKSGGYGNGIAVGLDSSGNLGLFGMNDFTSTFITIANASISNDIWYELYANTSKISLKKTSDGSYIENTGTATPGSGASNESIGIAYGQSPITGSTSTSGGFDGDVDIVEIWDIGTLAFPGGAIVCQAVSSISTLNAKIDTQLTAPAAESTTTNSSITIFLGVPVAAPAAESTTTATAGIDTQLTAPAAASSTALSAKTQIQITAPAAVSSTTFQETSVSIFEVGDAIVRYLLTITGAADSTTDIEIPMVSFQARRRSGAETFLQVVLPSVNYIDLVTSRSNGTLRIEQGYEKNNQILQRETIIETTIDRADTYKGSNKNSIVLTGYKQDTFAGKALTLKSSTYRAVVNGKINVRLAKPYIFLNPGDTVTIDSDTFDVGLMSYVISADQQQIEIQEA